MASGTSEPLGLPSGVNDEESDDQSPFSPDSTVFVAGHQASNTPFDYWIVDARSGSTRQLTRLGLASIDPARLPKAEIVHYKSFDGTVISALLWMPFNLARDGRAPAVVFPHGGPSSQANDYWNPNRTAMALASRSGTISIAASLPGARQAGTFASMFSIASLPEIPSAAPLDPTH